VSLIKTLSEHFTKERLEGFFMGKWYPVLTGALVLLEHLFGLELWLGSLNVLLASLSLLVCTSTRPLITFVASFVFQLSVKNSPAIPAVSDYLFTMPRLLVIIVLAVIFVGSAVYFSVKNRIFSGVNIRTPLLVPLFVLSLGFVMNGAFSGVWKPSSLVFGLCEAACFLVLFMLFYLGLRGEDSEELISYFVFSSAVVAAVLILEVGACYLTLYNGTKESMLFGWGIWNTAGVSLAVLIPVCFLGFYRLAERGRWQGWLYLALGLLTFFAAALTQSRNALLVGAIVTFAGFVIFSFIGKYRLIFRTVTAVGAVLSIPLAIVLWDRLSPMLLTFFYDNGRYELWGMGIDNFLSSPVFGVGFFGADFGTFFTAEFLPTMAHNTVVQLLSGMGVVGLLCYAFYRAATAVPFIKHPTVAKSFIGLSVLVLLAESMLDNFVFYFLPTLHYTVALAVVFTLADKEEREREDEESDDTESLGGASEQKETEGELDEPSTAL